MFIDLDLFKTDKQLNKKNKDLVFLTNLVFLWITAINTMLNFHQLFKPYIGSKSTWTILQKNMILIFNKLKEVYTNL